MGHFQISLSTVQICILIRLKSVSIISEKLIYVLIYEYKRVHHFEPSSAKVHRVYAVYNKTSNNNFSMVMAMVHIFDSSSVSLSL